MWEKSEISGDILKSLIKYSAEINEINLLKSFNLS